MHDLLKNVLNPYPLQAIINIKNLEVELLLILLLEIFWVDWTLANMKILWKYFFSLCSIP